jgi:uncharacterized protein (TIRG00374 family)
MREVRRYSLYVLMLLFAAWSLYSIHGDLAKLSLAPLLHSWDLVAIASLLSMLNYVLRIVRWRAYLRRLGHDLSLRFAGLTFVSGFAYTLSPGKVGEMTRARYYVPLGVPIRDTAGAFFCERFLDIVAVVALSMLLFSGSARYQPIIILGAVGSLVILLALALLPWPALAQSVQTSTRIPNSLRQALSKAVGALASTRVLLRPGTLLMGFVLGLIAWGLEGVGLGLLSSVFPATHLDMLTGVGIYAVAVLIGGLSFLPGGLGSTEAVMTALLATHGYSVSEALVITLLCRLVTLWLAVVLGWIAILILRQRQASPVAAP